MEDSLRAFAIIIAQPIEAMAVTIVAYGALEAFISLIALIPRAATHGQRKAVWRRFGMWLVLGLEFELAADIIETVVSPTWVDLGMLAAIAAVRTFLNYFLEKDLEDASPSEA
jgi:uncharacterized membrane protein